MDVRRQTGYQQELNAQTYLEQKGFQAIQRNYYSRWGEIDLIMRDQQTLVFVEVRSRRSDKFGTPLESIRPQKQRKLILAAKDYLLKHPYHGPLRFDVLGIKNNAQQNTYSHIQNAFNS